MFLSAVLDSIICITARIHFLKSLGSNHFLLVDRGSTSMESWRIPTLDDMITTNLKFEQPRYRSIWSLFARHYMIYYQ